MFLKITVVLVNALFLMLFSVSVACADELEKIEKVVVSGVGINADKAQQNAIRNAVEQVIGTYISSETLLKNNTLIRDEILSFSGGYVKESHIVWTGKDDDLITVKLEALVVATKLKDKMQALNIAFRKVDGGNLFGEAVSKINIQQSAAALFKGMASKYPQAAYHFEVGKPEIESTDPVTKLANIKIPTVIKLDQGFLEQLSAVLDNVSERKLLNFDLTKGSNYRGSLICISTQALIRNGFADRCYLLADSISEKIRKVPDGGLILTFVASYYSANIKFKDSAGNTVESCDYRLTWSDSYVKGQNYNGTEDRSAFRTEIDHMLLWPNANQWAPPNVVGRNEYPVFLKDGFMPLDLMVTVGVESLNRISAIEISMNELGI